MSMIDIAGRLVGPGYPCLVIAEAGVNHNGRLDLARQLVDVAVQAGADAVKFQTFTAETLATVSAPKARYQADAVGVDGSQYEMLQKLELSSDDHADLAAYCRTKGILFLSSPFDEASADLLQTLGIPAFKIPSGEITNLPLLAHIARKGKPLLISTGMASLGEVEAAVGAVEAAGNKAMALLHCVSAYPADPASVNLRAMGTLAKAFGLPVGYSDHTLGIEVALAAVALGACVIEKHFTLDRRLPGPDHAASAEPHELAALVKGIRTIEAALGDGRKVPAAAEAETAAVARKSLVAVQPIPAGTVLTQELIAARRPGTGLPPAMLPYVLGRRTRCDISPGALLRLEWLQ